MPRLAPLSCLSALLCTFALAACSGSGATATFDGGPSNFGVGVGGVCDPSHSCRAGLTCTAGVCQPSGTTADGSPCTIGDECASGVCGMSRTCEKPGTGVSGAGCRGDADCAKGLRCAFDGTTLFPKCLPEGKGDVGATCKLGTDCFEGLVCTDGSCAAPPPDPLGAFKNGVPPYVPSLTTLPWPGAKCPDVKKTGAITAMFTVPRTPGTSHVDGDFFAMPWPNDASRDASGKVDYSTFPHHVSPAIGFDAIGRYTDVLGDQPFGGYATSLFRFDGPFDFTSIHVDGPDKAAPQTRIIDLTEGPNFGNRRGINVFFTDGRNKYICDNYVAIRPAGGDPYQPKGTYAAIMMKGVTAVSDKSLAQAAPDFSALLAPTAPSDATLAIAYNAYAPLRKYLTMKSIAAADVLVANVFTVGDLRHTASVLRSSVTAAPLPAATGWVKCDTGVKSPCSQADGDRGCQAASAKFDELHALVNLPVFQKGTAPYLASPDGDIVVGATATSIPAERSESVCLSMTVPKGTAPAKGWPIAIYAHGTGGSFRSHAIDGTSAALSSIDLGGGTTAGFAVIGIDQVEHGPRRGSSTASPNDLFFNFANPHAARANTLQGAADQHAIVRLAQSLATTGVDKAVTGTAIALDAAHLVYWGHSQGSTEGSPFLAFDGSIAGAVTSGGSAGLIDSLMSKTSPVDIKDSLWIAFDESNSKSVDWFHPVLSILQAWSDPADSLYYAGFDVTAPKAGAAGADWTRSLFQPYGQMDTYTPMVVQVNFAFLAQLAFLSPELDKTGVTTVASVTGNVGGGKATAAIKQYAPLGYDGHFVAFKNATASADVATFLARVSRGEVPKL